MSEVDFWSEVIYGWSVTGTEEVFKEYGNVTETDNVSRLDTRVRNVFSKPSYGKVLDSEIFCQTKVRVWA